MRYLFIIIFGLLSTNLSADQISIPNEFTAGEKAVAADVNENFNTVASGVNNNDTAIQNNAAAIDTKMTNVIQTCAAGSAIRSINVDGNVECEVDDIGGSGSAGDITAVTIAADSGLTGGGDTGDVSIGIDPSIIQKRINNGTGGSNCATGEAINGIDENGLFNCELIPAPGVESVTGVDGVAVSTDLGVATISLADEAVTQAKIAGNAVGTLQIEPGAVTTNEIGTAAVTGNELAGDSIQSATHIVDEAGGDARSQAITSLIIVKTVADSPTLATAALPNAILPILYSGTSLSPTAVLVTSRTISPPKNSGNVLVTFNAEYFISHTNGTASTIRVDINTDVDPVEVTQSGARRYVTLPSSMPTGSYSGTITSMKNFAVSSAADVTYRVEADSPSGSGNQIKEYSISAIYYPTNY